MSFEHLADWSRDAAAHLTAMLKSVGGVVELLAPSHPNSSYVLNVEAPRSFAQMTVWASGRIDILLLDADSDLEVVNRTEAVPSEAALQARLDEFGSLILERTSVGL